ncbi:MAG: DUF6496 domain-containing protein [Candidatus Chromulinivorax sp.]
MKQHKIKKCQSCNEEMKALTGCMNCKEEEQFKNKVKHIMHEFKEGHLESRHGDQVKNPKQAIAIALNEARKDLKKKRL